MFKYILLGRQAKPRSIVKYHKKWVMQHDFKQQQHIDFRYSHVIKKNLNARLAKTQIKSSTFVLMLF